MLLEVVIGRLRAAAQVHVLRVSIPVVVEERVRVLHPGLLRARLINVSILLIVKSRLHRERESGNYAT